MLAGRRIAVVMPAYNEAKLIAGALDGIPSFVDHIIVVDDASLDATSKIVRAFPRPIDLTVHDVNQGVGAAIATGCRRALSLGADLTAVMAADGQMDPTDLPALLAPLIAGEADYTHGNRLGWPAAREAMPWHRWLGNHIFSSLTRHAIGVEVQDSQCGYAAMNRRTQRALDWDRLWKGYGYPNDLLELVVALRSARARDSSASGLRGGAERDTASPRVVHHPLRDRARVGSETCTTTRARRAVSCGCTGQSQRLEARSSRQGLVAGRRFDEEDARTWFDVNVRVARAEQLQEGRVFGDGRRCQCRSGASSRRGRRTAGAASLQNRRRDHDQVQHGLHDGDLGEDRRVRCAFGRSGRPASHRFGACHGDRAGGEVRSQNREGRGGHSTRPRSGGRQGAAGRAPPSSTMSVARSR